MTELHLRHGTTTEGSCELMAAPARVGWGLSGLRILEEIYYFEVAAGPAGEGFGYQRCYGPGPAREIEVLAEVRTGDAVLLPHGSHGPSMAAPGYDLYYLNVMAGPGERAWRFRDDPDRAWIRGTWHEDEIDSRLPTTGPKGRDK